MIRILFGALASAVILTVWGALAWTAIGLHEPSMHALTDESGVRAVLRETAPESGAYFLPGMPHDPSDAAALEAWEAHHREGPVAFIVVHPDGLEPMAPSVFLRGFVNALAQGLLASLFLAVAATNLPRYVQRVAFTTALGLFVALAADVTYEVYMYFPGDYTSAMVFDRLIGWLLVGLALAAILRPRPARA